MNLIVSAPSGSGKTTILKEIFKIFPDTFGFSVSATTRQPRQGEKNGVDYYFLSQAEFDKKIFNGDFLEYEQVYQGLNYGTLKSEITRIEREGKIPVFDVDVKGGVTIKNVLKENAYSVFIMPPSIETLKERLIKRDTETEESLRKRIERAEMEISYNKYFDEIIVNDDLQQAVEQMTEVIKQYVIL